MSHLGFDDAPPPMIEDIRSYLLDCCYPPSRANAIATYCWLWMTTNGCPEFLSEKERGVVKDLLDGCSEVAWNDYDQFVWSVSESS